MIGIVHGVSISVCVDVGVGVSVCVGAVVIRDDGCVYDV